MKQNTNKIDDKRIIIFDTTLRDGEQSPGASMNTEQKIQIASALEILKVDIIEAGFAAASKGDFDAISNIAKQAQTSTICSLARAIPSDIKLAGEAIAYAKHKRIHTFIATSEIHMKHKLKMSCEQVLIKTKEAVQYAKTFVDDVEFSLEDAGRSDISFMKEVSEVAINAGAKTINLPDTVGYRFPDEIYEMVKQMNEFINGRAIISLHNHNDLGLAVANTLAGIKAGARQVECTINGLGERAGNGALEEIVMAIKVRNNLVNNVYTNIDTTKIYPTSRLVATITGIQPQPNKAIVGKNAFLHESGIHQDGILKNKQTYEIMTPQSIGLNVNSTLILGKHSGRAAFKDAINTLGLSAMCEDDDKLNALFEKFKLLADKKSEILDDDIRMLVTNEDMNTNKTYELVSLQISDFSNGVPMCCVSVKYNDEDEIKTDASIGSGTMDSIFKTIDKLTKHKGALIDYKVISVTQGKDALASVTTRVSFDNMSNAFTGHGLDLDTMNATANAYLSALNSYIYASSINNDNKKNEARL
jgi:2-isopropylmalate synthase